MPYFGASQRPSRTVQPEQRPTTTSRASSGSYSEGSNAGWPYFQTTGPAPAPTHRTSRNRTTRRPTLNAQTQGIYGF